MFTIFSAFQGLPLTLLLDANANVDHNNNYNDYLHGKSNEYKSNESDLASVCSSVGVCRPILSLISGKW